MDAGQQSTEPNPSSAGDGTRGGRATVYLDGNERFAILAKTQEAERKHPGPSAECQRRRIDI